MPEATAPSAAPATAPAAPLAGASPAQPLRPGKAIGIDALVNGALDAIEADAQGAGALQTAPGPEPEAPLEEYSDDDPQEPVSTKGSKEDPLGINDLKSDQFVKIKIDGKEAVVSVREMADGFLRQETFKGRMRQAERVVHEAQAVVQQSNETRENDKAQLAYLIENGDVLFEFMINNPSTEAALRRAASKYATLYKQWKTNPATRTQFEATRDRTKLDQERKAWETKRQREDTDREQEHAVRSRRQELEPGWEAGLRESGWPNRADKEFQTEVRARVLAVTQTTREPITADQLRQCVVRAAKFLGTASEAKKPAPAAPTQRPRTAAQQPRNPSNGQFKANPHRRGTPEHLLFGLKPPRF